MRFDHLKLHDLVIALALIAAAIAVGASYRHVLAKQFAVIAPPCPTAPGRWT